MLAVPDSRCQLCQPSLSHNLPTKTSSGLQEPFGSTCHFREAFLSLQPEERVPILFVPWTSTGGLGLRGLSLKVYVYSGDTKRPTPSPLSCWANSIALSSFGFFKFVPSAYVMPSSGISGYEQTLHVPGFQASNSRIVWDPGRVSPIGRESTRIK